MKKRKFAKIYEEYADDIFRFIYVHVRDEALAEDLTADTFMKAWKSIDTFDFKNSRAWLYKIAQNLITDHWRKKQTVQLEEEDMLVDDKPSVEEQVDQVLSKERIIKALSHLPAEMRSVVTLRFIHGYSAQKAADSLGMSEGNVRVVQYRALKKLRGLLA